jgi:hypothetical protein
VAPFGIGALIGGAANATVATLAVRAARRAFGPAPQSWPETQQEVVPGIVLEHAPDPDPGSAPQPG